MTEIAGAACPGPTVAELAEKLGIGVSTAYRLARQLCPGRAARLTPNEAAAVAEKVKKLDASANSGWFRQAQAPPGHYTVTQLAAKLGVSRPNLLNAVYRVLPYKRGASGERGGHRPRILIAPDEAEIVKVEVARVKPPGRRPKSPRGQKQPRLCKPHKEPPTACHSSPPAPFADSGTGGDDPSVEDIMMSVLDEQFSQASPPRVISFENLARAFKLDPDDLRLAVYARFQHLLAVPGEPSVELTPNELVRAVISGRRGLGAKKPGAAAWAAIQQHNIF